MNKKVKKSKSLKQLKKLSETYFLDKNYEEALLINEKIISYYPKNLYGYQGVIRARTHEYNYYLENCDLKLLKKTYDEGLLYANKKDKENLIREFEEYLYDCKEVENLRQLKKEITSKELLKIIHMSNINFISQNIQVTNSYRIDGKKIKNIYDFINGLFLLICLIFNLFNHNFLLFLTLPFGIFGIINIYSFIDTNFFKKGKLRSEKSKIKDLILEADKRISDLEDEVKKIDDNLKFLYEQKTNTILKIPESFEPQIKEELSANEKNSASKLFEKLLDNNEIFLEELESNTNIKQEEIDLIIKKENDELSVYINSKSLERKNRQNELLYMKKITLFNIISTIILLIISIFGIVSLINNFYEINYVSFVIACIIGSISILIYNINNGRHKSLSDTFNDNLLSCVFNATIVYDLIYSSITNELKLSYGFIQMPLIFAIIFIGFAMLISLFKYNYFLKKLRR